jgi:sulfotransferase
LRLQAPASEANGTFSAARRSECAAPGMNNKIHFISGLPRSGSTLLSAILRKNPRFHAGMTSPVGAFVTGLLDQVSAGSEFGPVVTTAQRQRLLRGLFASYYADKPEGGVIFDTNRIWSARLPAVCDLFPDAKVIACVRNVAWVMDSIERLYRANPYENTRLFGDAVERNTVYSRVETLAQRNRLVGFAWTAIKEAFYSEQAGSLLVVDYDLLANAPDKVLPLVYQFIGEPWFEGHDFGRVAFDAPEFDTALGVAGLHKVRPEVSLKPRRTVLPPDLFAQYAHMNFWQDGANSRASVITARPADPAAGAETPSLPKQDKAP